MNQKDKKIYQLVVITIFAALCAAGVYIRIPIGTSFVHLGNFICILAGLLCGGVVGGLAGSLGMGLGDILAGETYDVFVRTFIVKFIMGFLAGYLFRCILKRKTKTTVLLLVFASVFGFVFLMSLINIVFFNGEISVLIAKEMTVVKISVLIPIFSGILFSLLLLGSIFSIKLKAVQKAVLVSVSVAVLVNIVLEFVLRIVLNISLGITFQAAFVSSISKLPAALITGSLTTILIIFIYEPIYKAVQNINHLNDLELQEEENE